MGLALIKGLGLGAEVVVGDLVGVAARRRRVAGQDGVAVFAPDGTLIGRILLPERCANLCFGGRKRNRLFMTASQSVYALYIEAQGNPGV